MKKNKLKIFLLTIILFVFIIFLLLDNSFTKAQSSFLENSLYKIVPDSKTGMINILIKRLNTYALYYSVPSSSKILIKYDNFQYLLESTGSVLQDFTYSDNMLTFKWGTKFLSLTQTVEFINLDEYNIGILVKIIIKNLDVKGHFIGLGILFDTYLGENYNKPFQISNLGIVDSEQYFTKSSIPLNIFSLDNPNNPVVGVVFYPRRTGITTPDKIIIANYDELINNFWNFSYVKGRSFSSTYKRLDAAIGYVYDESFINTNQIREISYILGFYPIKSASKTETEQTEKKDEKSEKVNPSDVDSKMNELKAYLEQQIKTLNDKIEALKQKYESIQQMNSAFFGAQDLVMELMDLLSELNYLENQIDELSEEEFNNLYQQLFIKAQEIIEKIKNFENSSSF